jgi:hypothetical protein
MELDEYFTVLPSVPFDPESKVTISIDGTTVTRRLETTLPTKSRLPALLAYYQDRLKWDQRTFHAVDWDVFGGVYPKIQHRRNFRTKFCYYTLPTGERLHRRGNPAMMTAVPPVMLQTFSPCQPKMVSHLFIQPIPMECPSRSLFTTAMFKMPWLSCKNSKRLLASSRLRSFPFLLAKHSIKCGVSNDQAVIVPSKLAMVQAEAPPHTDPYGQQVPFFACPNIMSPMDDGKGAFCRSSWRWKTPIRP